MLLIENEMSVSKAARVLRVYPKRLWNVFDYWISKAHKEDEVEDLTQIGFDETSIKKRTQLCNNSCMLKSKEEFYLLQKVKNLIVLKKV